MKEKINDLEPNLSADRYASSVSLEKINSRIEELQEKYEMEQKSAIDSIICLTTESNDALAMITELTMKVGELRGKLDSVNETLSKSGVEGDLEDEIAVLRFKLNELLSDLNMIEEEKELLEYQFLEETFQVEKISNLNSFLKSQVFELERMLAEEQDSFGRFFRVQLLCMNYIKRIDSVAMKGFLHTSAPQSLAVSKACPKCARHCSGLA